MGAKKYDVVAVTGKFTDAEGNEKNRYMTVGVILDTKNGFMLKLEAVPTGWDGWAYLNTPREKDGEKPAAAKKPVSRKPPAEDDIPF